MFQVAARRLCKPMTPSTSSHHPRHRPFLVSSVALGGPFLPKEPPPSCAAEDEAGRVLQMAEAAAAAAAQTPALTVAVAVAGMALAAATLAIWARWMFSLAYCWVVQTQIVWGRLRDRLAWRRPRDRLLWHRARPPAVLELCLAQCRLG
jgi:hypothetical protein